MSLSVFYAVRFSPAPELGEWLNVAVVGEGITERKAGVVVADSMQRIEVAFGPEAVERVQAICRDLSELVAAMASAHQRGEETQPIPTAMRDQALSMQFSEQIVVFEGTFEEALAEVSQKYLTSDESTEGAFEQAREVAAEQETDFRKIAGALQKKIGEIAREILPPAEAKVDEQTPSTADAATPAQSVASTVVLIGGAGPFGAALLPKLVANGLNVRVFGPSGSGKEDTEVATPTSDRTISILDIAKHAGVAAITASQVLLGGTAKQGVSSGTVERIREAAHRLGFQPGEHRSVIVVGDAAASMSGADAVISISESPSSGSIFPTGMSLASEAKARGIKRYIFVGPRRVIEATDVSVGGEQSAANADESHFVVTMLSLPEHPAAVDDAVNRVMAALGGEAKPAEPPKQPLPTSPPAIDWKTLGSAKAKPETTESTDKKIRKHT